MRVLVLGASGLLGSSVVNGALKQGHTAAGTYHKSKPDFDISLFSLDIRNKEKFIQAVNETEPDVIINCAAITDVDRCEKDSNSAFEVNGRAPGELASYAGQEGIRFIQISTDYVFAGNQDERYSENSEPNPVQVYGESKLAGELAVRDSNAESMIVRLSFVYGRRGDTGEMGGFPAWAMNQFSRGAVVPLISDQYVTPTRSGNAANAILELIERDVDVPKILHVACSSCITPYEFADILTEKLNIDSVRLEKQSIQDIERTAERPVNTCLDTSRYESLLPRGVPEIREDIDILFN